MKSAICINLFKICSVLNKVIVFLLLTKQYIILYNYMCCNLNRYGKCPGVAQFGSALEWGSRGREFDSRHSDHLPFLKER